VVTTGYCGCCRHIDPTATMIKISKESLASSTFKIFSSIDILYDIYLVYCIIILTRVTQLQIYVKMTLRY
jgi:hypothetical protein